jgi:hypothetical protein
MAKNIFISYRRQDSRDVAGRMCDRLLRHYQQKEIFWDIDDISPGQDFRARVRQEIGRTSIVLAMIGPHWLQCRSAAGARRIDEPDDMVRTEIEIALERGREIVPVLVNDAHMPLAAELPASIRALAGRSAFRLRPDPDFHRDMDRLVERIEAIRSRVGKSAGAEPDEEEQLRLQLEQERLRGLILAPQSVVLWISAFGLSGAVMLLFVALLNEAVGIRQMGQLIGAAMIAVLGGGDGSSLSRVAFVLGAALATCFAAGLVAAWCLYRRRWYWLAVAGVAIASLAWTIFLPVGLPLAIWAIYALFRPEVRAAFRPRMTVPPNSSITPAASCANVPSDLRD